MSQPTVIAIKRLGAVTAAIGITATFVWLLAVLNARAMVKAPSPPDLRTVLIQGAENDSLNQQPPEPERPPEPPEPEVMTVDLEMPAVESPTPEPLDIDLSVPTPSVSPIRVAVEPRPQAARPKPASPAPQQPAPARVRRSDEVQQPPREMAQNPAPIYPDRERQLGIEGSVTLKLLIDEGGRVANVEVVRGASSFRDAVMAVAYRWRFSPAVHEGRAVKVWGLKEVYFRVRGN